MDVSTSFDEQSGSIEFALGQSKAKRRIGSSSSTEVKGQQGGGNQSQFVLHHHKPQQMQAQRHLHSRGVEVSALRDQHLNKLHVASQNSKNKRRQRFTFDRVAEEDGVRLVAATPAVGWPRSSTNKTRHRNTHV